MRSWPADPAPVSRLLALAELAELVGAAVSLQTLAERVVELAARQAGDASVLWLPSLSSGELECAAVHHPEPAGRTLLAEVQAEIGDLDSGAAFTVVSTGEALLADVPEGLLPVMDVHPGYQAWLRRYGVSAIAILPLRARGRVVGALAMSRDRGREGYQDDDVLFLQALADVAGAGVGLDRLQIDSTIAMEELRREGELVNHVSDAVVVLDAEQRVVSWNSAAERIYGYQRGEVLDGDLFALLATDFWAMDGEATCREEVIANTLRTGGWAGELRERGADGRIVQSLASFSGLPDNTAGPGGIVVVNRDVTEQRHKEHLATHDALTSLPNRRLMSERLDRALAEAVRTRLSMALIFLDLNGFKAVNDRLGHDAGDEVLRVTARRLVDLVRGSDVVSRLGGDEFVVIATDVGPDGAHTLGRRILVGVSTPILVAGEWLVVPPSIGIALAGGTENPDELLRAADAAMYRAKQQGIGIAHGWINPADEMAQPAG
ncbi:MAG TPA: diguanylate cyclase [Mycobacteriales bacterium]|nr:diguanylate cyclase [Mycobacteriales bacterium]